MVNVLVSDIQGYSIHDGPGIRTLVFLKGCGLACRWCANPEDISPQVEVGFISNLCKHCGACAEVCPEGAIKFEETENHIDRRLCAGCGKCTLACSYKALVTYGKEMSIEEVFDAVRRDKMFYDTSGGGVTVSGGDPLLHPEFVRGLFEECHRAGINTCVETSGHVAAPNLLMALPVTDYVLYDIKHLDSGEHLRFTGHPNDRVLANAKLVADSGADFLFRMPLIPGVNDGLRNIHETAEFLKSLGGKAKRLELMPYHRLGESKYQALNRKYIIHGLQVMEPEQVEAVRQIFEENGIQCTVSR